MDGANVTPWERPGGKVEVEGTEIEEEGDAMMCWIILRRRGSNGQVEKEVATREGRRNEFKLTPLAPGGGGIHHFFLNINYTKLSRPNWLKLVSIFKFIYWL